MIDPYLEQVLTEAVTKKASDIHIKVGVPPYVRIHGSLIPFSESRLTKEEIDRMVLSLLDGDIAGRLKTRAEIDVAAVIPGVARFRVNIFRQRGTLEAVMRVVPFHIPLIEELGLPAVLKHIALEPRGLVLVTGITGSGKSTSIASMIQHLNLSLPVHVVTIEDPIEFVYRDEKASISQREVGIDTDTFHDALKYVLRQDPDVIVLGEMRDRETAQTAITAAETGHLVFSTLHTSDAVQTMDRIVDMFPPNQQDQIRHMMSFSLRAVVSMRLVARLDGKGMIPAVEIMMNTPAIRSLIEENKMSEIKALIADGASQYGMQTFDQSLLKLYHDKLISKESALEEATSSAELELAMRGITVGTMSAQSFIKSNEMDFYRQKAKEYFDRARRLFEQDLVEDSMREIRRALIDYPEYPEAKALLGKIEERMKRADIRSQADPFIKKGLELVAKDQIEEALVIFNQGLEKDPGNDKLQSLKNAATEKGQRIRGIKPLMDTAVALGGQGKYTEARAILDDILKKDPGNSEALDRVADMIQIQSRQSAMVEMEALTAKGEEAFGRKMWFDTIANYNQVREIQPDNQKAAGRIGESGAQVKLVGVPGLPPAADAPWTAGIQQAFEKGLSLFMGGQALNCLAEWRNALTRIPQAGDLLAVYSRKIEETHQAHLKYHLDRAKMLVEQGDLGKAMAQIRHASQVDPQSMEVRAYYEAQRGPVEQTVQRFMADAEQWEKIDRLRAAVFCWERALEIDPGREGLRQKVADGRARLAKLKDILSAMDRKT
jgi:twitching motility protein PilT